MAIAETRQPLATGRKHCQSQLQPAKLAKSVQWGVALHQKILLCQTSPYGILLYETPRFAKKICTDFQRCQLLRQLPKSLSAASENLTKQGGKASSMGASLRFAPILVGDFVGGLRPQPWEGFAPPNPPFPHPHTGMGGLCGFFKPKSLPQAWDGSQH